MIMVKKVSFKKKVIAFALLMSLVPVVLLGFICSYLFSESLQEEVDLHQQSILKHFEAQLNTYMARIDQISVSLASNAIVEKTVDVGLSMNTLESSLQFMETLKNLVGNSDLPIDISLILPNQDTVYTQTSGIIRQIYYPFSEINKIVWSGANTSYKIPPNTYTNQKDLLIVRPIPLNSPAPKGILIVHLKTNLLIKMMEQMAAPFQRILLVFDDQNRLVVSGQTWRTTESSDPTEPILGIIASTKVLPDHIQLNGETYILTSTQSSSNGWKYVAVASIHDLSQKSKNVQLIAWGLAGLIALIWGAVAVIGSNRLYSPLQRLVTKFSVKDDKHSDAYSIHSDIITNLDLTMQNLKEKNDRLMVRLNDQMPIMKEYALLNLLHGKLADPNVPDQAWQSELAVLKGNVYYVGIAEIDQWLEMKQTYSETDRSLMMYALRKWIEELGEAYYPILGISPKQGQLVFLMGVDEPGTLSEDRIKQFGQQLCNQIDRVFPFTLSVAIAGPRAGYDQIHMSFDEAQSLMAYRMAMGPQALILRESVGGTMNASIRRLIVFEHAVVSSMAQGQYDQADSNLNALVQEASQSLHSSEAILGLFTHLVGELDHFLQTSEVELSDVIGGDAMKALSEMSSLAQLHSWIRDTVLLAIREHLESLQTPRRKKLVQQAIAVLLDQLEQDVSLQLMASQLQISRATLSKWFKEETGDNFGDYLIRARMDKAKEWLSTSDMPIKTIAERLRYTSVTNFTRIFKQSTGATPGAYRTNFRASDE